jgi:hypothetical protein
VLITLVVFLWKAGHSSITTNLLVQGREQKSKVSSKFISYLYRVRCVLTVTRPLQLPAFQQCTESQSLTISYRLLRLPPILNHATAWKPPKCNVPAFSSTVNIAVPRHTTSQILMLLTIYCNRCLRFGFKPARQAFQHHRLRTCKNLRNT